MMGMSCVRVDISKATDPVLDFWYQGQGSRLDVLVAGGKDEPAVVKTISSEFGHDGFLLETEQICKAISSFLG